MQTFKVGDKVQVKYGYQGSWDGEGIVTKVSTTTGYATVRMTSGKNIYREGDFAAGDLTLTPSAYVVASMGALSAAPPPPAPTFKGGNKVRILRTARAGENGWGDVWVREMDGAVGKEGTVTLGTRSNHSVRVQVPDVGFTYNFPDFVLEHVQFPDFAQKEKAALTPALESQARFKVGDKVRVIRKYKDRESGWNNSWVNSMDPAVGKTGDVTDVSRMLTHKDVTVHVPEIKETWGYPVFALELVPPVVDAVDAVFAGGDAPQCAVQSYLAKGGRISHANLDAYLEQKAAPNPVAYLEQKAASEAGKQIGISRAIRSHGVVFERAKGIAIDLGKSIRYVHAELVQAELEKLGYTSADLGNAAGGIFRSSLWKDTGRAKLSNRKLSHRRKITVWEYVGEGLKPQPSRTDLENFLADRD